MRKSEKSSPVKTVVLSVVSFLLSLTFVFITALSVAGVTLFNDNDLLARVSETMYFSELSNEILTRCATVAARSGVDFEAVEDVLSAGRIDADFTVYFNSVSEKNPTAGRETVDEKSLAEELYSAIVSYDGDITESEKTNARIAAGKMASEYKNSIVFESFESYISYADGFKATGKYVFWGLVALAVYLMLIIVLFNGRHQKHRLFRKFAIVAGSSGLTVLVFSLLIRFSGILKQITFVSAEREYDLFMSFFNDFLNFATVSGLCWIVVCIILLASWYMSVTGRLRK